MLNGIIGEEAQELIDDDESTDKAAKRKSRCVSVTIFLTIKFIDFEFDRLNVFISLLFDFLPNSRL